MWFHIVANFLVVLISCELRGDQDTTGMPEELFYVWQYHVNAGSQTIWSTAGYFIAQLYGC